MHNISKYYKIILHVHDLSWICKWQTVKKMDAKGKIIPSGWEFNFQHYVVNLECSWIKITICENEVKMVNNSVLNRRKKLNIKMREGYNRINQRVKNG